MRADGGYKACNRRECERAGERLPLSEFHRSNSNTDGHQHACKRCQRAMQVVSRSKLKAKHAMGIPTAPMRPAPTVWAAAPTPAPPAEPLEAATQDYAERRAERDLRAQHRALLEEVHRQRSLLEALRPLHGTSSTSIPPAPPSEKHEAVPLILASDWHVEEEVDREKMHGVNEYNLTIAQARAEKFFQNSLRLVSLVSRDSLVRRVVVGLIGDLFSNSIHLELMEINQLGPQPAARFAKDLLAAGIRYWLENSDLSFEFCCVGGNHGRMTEKTRIATNAENSLETFAYHFLAAEFRGEKRVTFRIATGDMVYSDVFEGYRVRFCHGDQIGYAGGIGGLTIPLNKWVARQDNAIRADLTVLGHFHQRLDGGRFLVNGSLIGATPYSQRFGFSPEPPAQQFALLHPRRGKSIVAPIWVEPSDPGAEVDLEELASPAV